jgi:hypothetical protein
MSESRLYLAIPFAKKDELKKKFKLGWCLEAKMWYAQTEEVYTHECIRPFHIIDLDILYKFKDAAKLLGAKWSGTTWYIPAYLYDQHQSKWDTFEGLDEPTV